MSFLHVGGSRFNLFDVGSVSISPASAAVSNAIGGGDPSAPFVFGSVAADSYMRVQINALTNPGFETSTLSGWTDNDQGTGASTEEVVEVRTGSKALKLTGTDSSNYGSRYQDITVNAGDLRKTSIYIDPGSGGSDTRVYLRNLRTGNYYNGSAWASTRAAAIAVAGIGVPGYVKRTVTYQIESYETCRADTVTLRFEIANTGNDSYVDDCLDVPGVTWASIHGHNYGGGVSPLVQSSDDGSAWTTQATMTIKRPAFFSTFSIIYAEYWQIKLSGTNFEAPYTGEAVLGQYQTSATSPQWGIPKTRSFPGVRTRSPGARHHVYNFATDPPEDIEATFSARTAAAASEIADSIWLRSAQGQNPTIFVPIDTEADVYYGRLIEPHTVARPFTGVHDCTLRLMGDPLPTVGL